MYNPQILRTFANTMSKIGSLIHSAGVRNFAKLLSANVIAQLIGLLVYPVLTRLYSPDDFGLLNLFLSIGGILSLLATAEYQYAIVLPRKNEKARAVLQLGGWITLCVTGAVLLSVPFSRPIATLFNAPDLARWYWLMPVFVLVSACWVLLNYYYTRHKCFGAIARYQMSQSVLNAGAKIGCGYAGFLHGGLLCSTVFAPLVALVISIAGAWRKGLREVLHIDKKVCREVAREYANFPKYSLPRALVNNLSNSLPSLLLTPFFGLANLGFWGMALTLAFRPINMIEQSLYQVLYQHISAKVNRRETIRPILRRFSLYAMGITIPCFGALYFVLPWLTQWLLGSGWEITGHYIRVMLPWLAMNICAETISFLIDVFQKQRINFYIELGYWTFHLAALLIGIVLDNFYYAIVGYCMVGFLFNSVRLGIYTHLIEYYERNLISDVEC